MKVKESALPRWAQSVTGEQLNEEKQQRNTVSRGNKSGTAEGAEEENAKMLRES